MSTPATSGHRRRHDEVPVVPRGADRARLVRVLRAPEPRCARRVPALRRRRGWTLRRFRARLRPAPRADAAQGSGVNPTRLTIGAQATFSSSPPWPARPACSPRLEAELRERFGHLGRPHRGGNRCRRALTTSAEAFAGRKKPYHSCIVERGSPARRRSPTSGMKRERFGARGGEQAQLAGLEVRQVVADRRAERRHLSAEQVLDAGAEPL